eukprot:XP_762938.1 hypothetical protein [Theileria parva strain Muguga]
MAILQHYIPPLLDKYQDVEVTFKLMNNLNLFNEFNTIVNSVTAPNNTFFIDKNLIRMRIDRLDISFNYYKELLLNYKLHVYFTQFIALNLIKADTGVDKLL